MIFLPGTRDSGNTVFEDQPPASLRHLLLPYAGVRYVHGPFGSYLSQWIGNDELSFQLDHFFVSPNNRLFPRVESPAAMLYFILEGAVNFGLYRGDSMVIADHIACFFFLPGGVEHSLDFNGCPVVSMHFNYHPVFFSHAQKQYPVLQQLLSTAHGNNIGAHELPVPCGHEQHHLWKSLPSHFRNTSLCDALLSEKGRELLRVYCDGLMAIKERHARPGMKDISIQDLLFVKAVQTMIESDVKIHYSLEQLANDTHWNVFRLKKIFPRVYGTTPYQYLIQRRMLFGKHLVLSTNELIGSIARECGYRQQHHFIKLFRQTFGITPAAMRKETTR